MNTIIRNLIRDFLKSEEIESSDDAKNFENFCNFSIISSEYKSDFSIEDISMGSTQGIDGIAIIVNGNLITTTEEIDDLVVRNNFLEASFIFTQAKTSNSFDGADISNFFVSISDFLSDEPKSTQSTEIKRAITLKEKVWEHVSKMTKGKPICKIYYVTTGTWQRDKSLESRINGHKSDLEKLSLFQKIEVFPCGADEIQQYYLRTKRTTRCEFTFDKHIVLPVEERVQEAYFGIVNFAEFKKIISDDGDEIKDVFYENVRAFLGESNNVNKGIEATLENKEFDIFCLLNNGVTIVANSKTNKGNKFFIENYQIVNGCQTSHVLFNNKEIDGINQIYIPLKLIITDDENIQNKIIIATNNQTSIPKEQLEAFSKFQKDLELYYQSEQNQRAKLFYERRQKQYRDKDVSRPRIVTIREQIKSFAAMFLDQPHTASGYFSKVYNNNREQMFISGHKFYPYYISSLTMYILESFFKTGKIDKKYRIARYHIIMIFKTLSQKLKTTPSLGSKKIEDYCEEIKKILLNTNKALKYFKKSIEILDSVPSINIGDQKTLYTAENTEALKSKMIKLK
ncbi:MAG: AIPR family protein [Proteobacteria bacterium]|nr:AIPR family protein [Pseudomonadota bacterium]